MAHLSTAHLFGLLQIKFIPSGIPQCAAGTFHMAIGHISFAERKFHIDILSIFH
jgi:hypothetical protein